MDKSPSVWNEDELVRVLEARASSGVIGIDGLEGAGKSHIALRLKARLNWPVVHCDDFIQSGAKQYPENLDIPALRSLVLAPRDTPKLLDSILLGTVLDALGLSTAPFVYVRRHNLDRSYSAPEYYENFEPERMLSIAKKTYLLAGAQESEPMLECELIRYHQRYDPVSRALVVFENVASS